MQSAGEFTLSCQNVWRSSFNLKTEKNGLGKKHKEIHNKFFITSYAVENLASKAQN